jgi:hypothetical protein
MANTTRPGMLTTSQLKLLNYRGIEAKFKGASESGASALERKRQWGAYGFRYPFVSQDTHGAEVRKRILSAQAFVDK